MRARRWSPETRRLIPDIHAVHDAARRLQGVAHRTPVLRSRQLDAMSGASLYFKCENLQRGGAFKFRGAWNAISALPDAVRARGVAAYSSGNHAQAVALAASLHGIPATIVMPHDTPAPKLAATEGYGAHIVRYDRYTEDRAAICQAIADSHGLTVIPPFDHPDVIAGQGTAALELFEECGPVDALFMPLGGGGLLAGSLLVAVAQAPECRVYGVEPLAGNDGQRSLASGERVRIETPVTIADGAQTTQLGEGTFPLIREHVADILTVDDAALARVMRLVAERMKLIVEPTGCLGLAGLLSRPELVAGKRVGVIFSGGNVELARLASLAG